MNKIPVRWFSRTAAILSLLVCGALPAVHPADARPAESRSTSAQARVVRARTIGEVLSRWKPDVHLYVMGDVGLEDDALQELAAWLADKHWTVLLVEDASGQTYSDIDGVVRQDDYAIEYGVGQGMPRRRGFSAQVHPRTGEADGAVLSIVLAQRALFYSGSAAQDNRSLGEDHFKGNLDQWAIPALRSGDIVRAVQDTVTQIGSRLEAAITAEIQEKERAVAAARSSVQGAAEAVATLEARAAALRQLYPQLTGPLVEPDLPALRRDLAAAESFLTGDLAQATRAADAVREQAKAQIREIVEYPAAGRALEAEGVRLGALERRERAAVAVRPLTAARRHLASARELHARGDLNYKRKLDDVRRTLASAEQMISDADAGAARQRSAARFLIFLGVSMIAGLGFLLNRGRREVKRRAEKLLADWRTALDRKLEILFDELERRVELFVGPAGGEGRRPYAGETLRRAEQIRADVGALSILWTSANSVLQKAEALIQARGLGAVYNFFLPGKYVRAITLLEEDLIPFDPAEGLPRLFGQERTWREELLGDLASYEPFHKTFEEIIAELNLRSARATESLDLIEKSVVQGPGELNGTEERIRQTGLLQEEIESAGAADRLFLVPAVFTVALPAAEAALARARGLFATDPITALQGDGAAARRIAVEAAQLADLALESRRGVLAALESGAAALRSAAISTGWLETERSRFSQQADHLAVQAAREPVSPEIEELAQRLAGLGGRVGRAVALSGVLGETARPEIRRLTGVVQAARTDLGKALALPADRLLVEEGDDPSERLKGAARQADLAQEALGRGDLDAAEAALGEAAWLTSEAAEIVEATRKAFADHAETVGARRAETRRIERLLPENDRILAGIRQTFAPGVLLLRAGDPGDLRHPEENGTLADNLEEARAHVGLAHEKLDRAVAAHQDGRLLASADLLEEIRRHQELAVHRLEEIAEKRSRLDRTVESNRNLLATLESRVREDRISVAGDPRVMQPTLAAFEEGTRQVGTARRAVEAVPGDPFVAEEALLAAKATLDEVHDQRAPSDRLLFTEAQRSVEAASLQLTAAQDLARRAAGDGIPDSPGIVSALRNIEGLWTLQSRAAAGLQSPHGDWKTLDYEADQVAASAAHQAATLTGQIAAAESASTAITNAAQWVRDAASWSGGYGVTIPGEPGSSALHQARAFLAQGRYEDAVREAGHAWRAAADAIEAAKAMVERLREEERRREAERRAYEERRRRESYARSSLVSSSSGSGSSSGSSRSSWSGGGGGGSRSGSGRSSWSGSRSGSGRSSW